MRKLHDSCESWTFDPRFGSIQIASLTCPLTHQLMANPVRTRDGHMYEREAIEKWLSEHTTSPLTNLHLVDKTLVRDRHTRKMIRRFLRRGDGGRHTKKHLAIERLVMPQPPMVVTPEARRCAVSRRDIRDAKDSATVLCLVVGVTWSIFSNGNMTMYELSGLLAGITYLTSALDAVGLAAASLVFCMSMHTCYLLYCCYDDSCQYLAVAAVRLGIAFAAWTILVLLLSLLNRAMMDDRIML